MIGRAAASLDSGLTFSSSVLSANVLRADCGSSGVGCVGTAVVPFCAFVSVDVVDGVVFGTTAAFIGRFFVVEPKCNEQKWEKKIPIRFIQRMH